MHKFWAWLGLNLGKHWILVLTVGTLVTVGLGFVVTTFLSGLAGGAGHLISGAGAHIGAVLVSLVLNIGVFWLSFRIATVFKVRWRNLWIGAAIAAFCWQVLQVAGGYVISHQLHRASELYGTFGIVLGLMAWLFLQAELTLYAAEVDVVLARGLWPASITPDKAGQPDEAQQAGGEEARSQEPSSLEEQPGAGRQAAAGERPPVPSPRDEPSAGA